MTINSTKRVAGPYLCNSSQTVFSFDGVAVEKAADISVIKTDADGYEDVLGSSAYTVTLNADQSDDPGGYITTSTAYATGEKITVTTDVDLLQEMELTNGGDFNASVINLALDRIVVMCQQLLSASGRSLRFPISDGETTSELPTKTARSLKYLACDVDGNIIAAEGTGTNPVSSAMAAVVASASIEDAISEMGVATQDSVDLKAPIADPDFTGTASLNSQALATEPNVKYLAKAVSGHLYGFTLSYNNTDRIDVAAGSAADSTGVDPIVKSSATTACILQASGAWAAGNTANKLDAGARANSTCYHVFEILKTDYTADVLFSLSATAPTLPAGYTKFRRIGSIFTDGSGNIRQFLQTGDDFYFSSPVLDVMTAVLGTTAIDYTLTIPNTVSCTAIMNIMVYTASNYGVVYISDPRLTDLAPSLNQVTPASTVSPIANAINISNNSGFAQQVICRSNTSAQIRARASATATFGVATCGYVDTRGRF